MIALSRLIVRYNLRSLMTRGTDALMTLAGIALTAAVLVVVLSLAHGLEAAFQASGHDGIALVMYKGADAENTSQVDFESARIIETMPGIAKRGSDPFVSGETFVLMNIDRRGVEGMPSNVVIRGVGDAAFEMRPEVKIIAGRKMNPDVGEVVVGKRIAERFKDCGLGETFGFGRNRFKVVGVFECPGAGESEIWGHVRDVQGAFQRPFFSSMRIKLAGPDSLPVLREAIKKESRIMVKILDEREYYKEQQKTAEPLKFIAWVLAVCMAFGASLGAMNTMYARVASRAREIGTLRAIGFRSGHIVLAFIAESVALATSGGAFGCLIALPVHGLSTGTTNFQTFSEIAFAFTVSPATVAPALVLAATVGFLGGLLPAFQAARMAIPVALREV